VNKNRNLVIVCMWMIILGMVFLLLPGCQGQSTPAHTGAADGEGSADDAGSPDALETPFVTTVTEEKPITGQFVRRTKRDPFALPGGASSVVNDIPEIVTNNTQTQPTPDKTPTTGGPSGTPKPDGPMYIKPETIGVTITGIMKSGNQYKAILKTQSGKDYMVASGDKVGEWTVSKIDADSVMLKAKNFYSKVVLDTDIGGPGVKSEKVEEDPGPKVPTKETLKN
jgi:type IV pilus biogenesis protein PilP